MFVFVLWHIIRCTELERVLKLRVENVLEIAKTTTTIKIRLPFQYKTIFQTLTKQHMIEKLFSEEYWNFKMSVAMTKSGISRYCDTKWHK